MSVWIKLQHALKTEQTYRAINLLEEYHIQVRTLPDEFNGKVGNARLLSMDSDVIWPLYVKRKQMAQAIAILTAEQLFPILHDVSHTK